MIGYKNERRVVAASNGATDLRRNGTYLVLRQLEQDVPAFNDFVAKAATLLRGGEDMDDKKEWVAARLVGRCPGGKPLAFPPLDPGQRTRCPSTSPPMTFSIITRIVSASNARSDRISGAPIRATPRA